MAVTLYTSFDAGAPQMTASPGGVVAILDACLVNGYGSKSPLGWTKPFSGTNKAVYRAASGTQKYLRVDDTNAGWSSMNGYHAMTDVDTGTTPFPFINSVVSPAPGYIITAARATTMAWELIGDDKRFYFCVWNSANTYSATAKGGASQNNVAMFGDFVSHIPADTADCCVISGPRTNSTYTQSTFNYATAVLSTGPSSAMCSARNYFLGTVNYLNPTVNLALLHGSNLMGSVNGLAFPNGPDGGIYFGQILLTEQEGFSTQYVRGHLPGIWCPYHSYNSYNHGDTFSGTGAYAGRTFRVWQLYNSSLFVETSDTWS